VGTLWRGPGKPLTHTDEHTQVRYIRRISERITGEVADLRADLRAAKRAADTDGGTG
jgi:hypothetical protein